MPRSTDGLAPQPAAAAPRVALIGDRADRHAAELAAALRRLGARPAHVSLPACRFDTAHPDGLRIEGYDDALPDAALIRTMSGGSFEAVTMRLGILHALREHGVLVCNDARAIERCVDKSTTSFLLAHAGISTPETWTTESADTARAVAARECARGPLVLKPLFGSQGRGLRLIRGIGDLPEPAGVAGGVYYLQRFVGEEREGFRDFRLLVSRGRVVAAMMRHAPHWITNVKRGGRPVAVAPDAAMRDLALRAATAVGADFAGVDILHAADGRPSVLEVNSMPAWSGLQQVTPHSIAAVLAADLLATLAARGRHAEASA